MSYLVLEGTWEEVASHADELAGKKVRLIVVEDAASANDNHSPSKERPLSEALEGLIGIIDSSEPGPPFPHKRSAFGDAIVEKFRKQGLKIP